MYLYAFSTALNKWFSFKFHEIHEYRHPDMETNLMQHFEKPSYRNGSISNSSTSIVLSRQENRETNVCNTVPQKELQSNSMDDHKIEKASFQSAWSRNMLNVLRAKLNNFRDFQGKKRKQTSTNTWFSGC